ncbi:MAG TPA: cupin domain-containing protein [Bordetella sp.]|nr:cupin domain-containing protein [Bordetella sp.]
MLDFDQIMAPLGAQVFLRDYWLRQFVHIRGKAGRFTALLTWDALNGMLQQHRLTPPRLKLYKDGQPLDPSQYLTPAMFGVPRVDAGRLILSLAEGASLILDDVQEMAPHVRDLMGAFQDALQTDAFANLYAGWHNNNAFNRHWDPQEAVVLQLAGRKRWRVYRPTRPNPLQNDDAPPPTVPPAWEGTLNDGDVLYIPRGWWHEAVPLGEPSLHLTVSLTPPTALDYLGWVMSRLRNHAELRAGLQPAGNGTRQGDMAAKISALVTDALRAAPLEEFQLQWEANMRPNPHIRLPDAPYDQLAALSETSLVRLASLHRLAFARVGENFEFAAAGRLWTVPKALQPALAQLQNNRECAVRELGLALTDAGAKADLLKSLGVLAQAGVVLARKG